ncbi:hypothetical protein CEXT_302801 [Caerostris extrusa]|uniref:Uncharacterized protein n=1 Tax=Caerostris extrusa TaxID=172846 RepID=A0AAV4NJN9_CAEEX|nr:hypothetical protein CEXT_302801 [Caerostris extrusa]
MDHHTHTNTKDACRMSEPNAKKPSTAEPEPKPFLFRMRKRFQGTKKATAAAALGYRSESLGIMKGLVLGSQSSDWLAYGVYFGFGTACFVCVCMILGAITLPQN